MFRGLKWEPKARTIKEVSRITTQRDRPVSTRPTSKVTRPYFFFVVVFLAGFLAGAFLAGAFFAMALVPPFFCDKCTDRKNPSQILFVIESNNFDIYIALSMRCETAQ